MILSSSDIYYMVKDWIWFFDKHNYAYDKDEKEALKNLTVYQLMDKTPIVVAKNISCFCHILLGEPQIDHKELINQLRVYIQKYKEIQSDY